MLDQNQLVIGVSVLMSFFVGYRYALRISGKGKRKTILSKLHTMSTVLLFCKSISDEDEIDSLSKTVKTSRRSAPRGEYKMVLVVRNDLKMGKGKIGAQCGHASVGAYQKAMERNPASVQRWDDSGCAKICVKVESESEMMNIRKAANIHGLNYYLVHDAGRTQIAAGSATVLALGPDLVQTIDQLTGHLKLL